MLYSDHLGGKPKCKQAAARYYLQQHVPLLATVVIAPEDLRALVRSGADGGRTSGQLARWMSGTVWPLHLQPSSKWLRSNCNFAIAKGMFVRSACSHQTLLAQRYLFKIKLLLFLKNPDWINLKRIKGMYDVTDYFAIIQILVFLFSGKRVVSALSDCLSLSAFSQFVLKCRVCFILASLNSCSLVQTYTKRSSAQFMLFL